MAPGFCVVLNDFDGTESSYHGLILLIDSYNLLMSFVISIIRIVSCVSCISIFT